MMNWTVKTVRQALRYYPHIPRLGACDLGRISPLTTLLRNETNSTKTERGYLLQAMLRWGLNHLQNSHSTYEQQSAETLKLRYIEQYTVAETAEHLHRSDDTVKHRQRKGLKRLTELLESSSADSSILNNWLINAIELQYNTLSTDEQRTLRFLSHLNTPLSWRVSSIVELPFFIIAPLQSEHWVEENEAGQISIHPAVQKWVQKQVSREEKREDHIIIATYYEEENQFADAITHWQQTDTPIRGAELLIEHFDSIPVSRAEDHLRHFERSELPLEMWETLYLLRGRVAHTMTCLGDALEQYQLALTSSSTLIRAEAYYLIARVYEMRDIDASLLQYQSCLELLKGQTDEASNQLRFQALINEAWIFIDSRIDLDRAYEQLLQATETSTQGKDRKWIQLLSNLHTAWGEYYVRMHDMEQCAQHQWKAWSYARESDNIKMMINTSFNLGLTYLQTGRGKESYQAFQDCHELTIRVGNQEMTAMVNKALGMYHVMISADYVTAIPYYLQSYQYMKRAENHHLLAGLSYDLAEAYLLSEQPNDAISYYKQSRELATMLDHVRLSEALDHLEAEYNELQGELTPVQRKIIGYIRIHTQITKQQCMDLIEVSSRQALRQLNGLIELNKVERIGRNRNTAYILANENSTQKISV